MIFICYRPTLQYINPLYGQVMTDIATMISSIRRLHIAKQILPLLCCQPIQQDLISCNQENTFIALLPLYSAVSRPFTRPGRDCYCSAAALLSSTWNLFMAQQKLSLSCLAVPGPFTGPGKCRGNQSFMYDFPRFHSQFSTQMHRYSKHPS